MKKEIFKGCGTAIITPFTENGVNYEEFEKLVNFQIENGADAIIVCGTTGESATMTDAERKKTMALAVKVSNGRVPIIAGTGSNNPARAVEMSRFAEEVGVDAILVVTPFYNKASQSGLVEYYKMVAKSVNLPVIMYNVPSRTGVNIEPKTCLELSKVDNIVAVKEASGDISQVAEIAHLCGDNLAIYSGNDDQTLPILSLGGIGVISVWGNLAPKDVHEMVYSFLDGDIEKARKIQLNALELIKYLFCEVNPIPVKAGLNIMGFEAGKPRLPLTQMSPENKDKLESAINKYFESTKSLGR